MVEYYIIFSLFGVSAFDYEYFTCQLRGESPRAFSIVRIYYRNRNSESNDYYRKLKKNSTGYNAATTVS